VWRRREWHCCTLQSSNEIGGRLFAELTHELFSQLATAKYVKTEYRISVYGSSANDWKSVAEWAHDFDLYSPDNMWMVQIPRIYTVFRTRNVVQSYGDVLRHVFEPLFAVTMDESSDPKLARFLRHLGGFDSVDDESRPERELSSEYPLHRSKSPHSHTHAHSRTYIHTQSLCCWIVNP